MIRVSNTLNHIATLENVIKPGDDCNSGRVTEEVASTQFSPTIIRQSATVDIEIQLYEYR